MSYQVLARKWRPKNFQEMVGQENVLRALINALDNDRMHHAFLFTGTRGVGKTTIARILAKSLNCLEGVRSHPCGVCSACQGIDEGRFVDLIEVDAASRTKVEDTRELLENVQYSPTCGRYKVYLIDEVHMLSAHSFNALLKTLEEPPSHVKFLLATTDPQKLPVTILSRCLQFNLKSMSTDHIVGHLKDVLQKEAVEFDSASLSLLARSAEGSMRDALSLLDQAIAFGSGRLNEDDVRTMLGSIDLRHIAELVKAIAGNDANSVINMVRELAQFAPDYVDMLAEMISLFHRIALAQIVPTAIDNSLGDQEIIVELAQNILPEDVQLFYQIALIGRKDLPFVPDIQSGFEMILLRMLAFKPAIDGGNTARQSEKNTGQNGGQKIREPSPSMAPAQQTAQSAPAQSAPAQSAPAQASSHSGFQAARDALKKNSEKPVEHTATPKVAVTSPQRSPVQQHKPVVSQQIMTANKQQPQGNQQRINSTLVAEEMDVVSGGIDEYQEYLSQSNAAMVHESTSNQGRDNGGFATTEKSAVVSDAVRPILSSIIPDVETKLPKSSLPESNRSNKDEGVEVIPSINRNSSANINESSPVEGVGFDVWNDIVAKLDISGMAAQLAVNCSLISRNDNTFKLMLAPSYSNLLSSVLEQKLLDALIKVVGQNVKLIIETGVNATDTPAEVAAKDRAALQKSVEEQIMQDTFVNSLKDVFNAEVQVGSIKPI